MPVGVCNQGISVTRLYQVEPGVDLSHGLAVKSERSGY
jgi:hypothetical protein